MKSKKQKLSVEDFYHQFHNAHRYSDSEEKVRPKWHQGSKGQRARHRGLNLKSLAATSRRG